MSTIAVKFSNSYINSQHNKLIQCVRNNLIFDRRKLYSEKILHTSIKSNEKAKVCQPNPSNRSESTMHLCVNITFDSCPIGFEQSNFTGECICDHRLWHSCDLDRQAILRNASGTFWLGIWYNNGTPEGFIHHPYYPLDYCTRESRFFSLKNPDKQCIIPTVLVCCVGSAKKDLVLSWAAPNAKNAVTIIWLCLFHLH